MIRHTDIVTNGWVGYLPKKLVPYVLLARLDRPIGSWLLFLPGLWSILLARAPAVWTLWLIFLFGIGAVVMRAAGCVVNDFWDREIDRKVGRTEGRPLASGALSLREAGLFLLALLMVGALILLCLPRLAQALGLFSLLLIGLYPLAKRITFWPQIMLGFTFGWGAPMGYAAATNDFSWAAAVLYGASIFWILGYDTIYAHQDREDDALAGIKSTALKFGEKSALLVGASYTLTCGMLVIAGWLAGLNAWFVVALIVPVLMLTHQVVRLDIHDPAQCLKLFKANRDVGLAVAAALLLGRI